MAGAAAARCFYLPQPRQDRLRLGAAKAGHVQQQPGEGLDLPVDVAELPGLIDQLRKLGLPRWVSRCVTGMR